MTLWGMENFYLDHAGFGGGRGGRGTFAYDPAGKGNFYLDPVGTRRGRGTFVYDPAVAGKHVYTMQFLKKISLVFVMLVLVFVLVLVY